MSDVTPMMAQYLEIKARAPGALLFYRMGDFYEMFFEDAVAAAAALDIALTKRGKHLGEDIPMCGVPVHSAESYLLSLIRKGFHVAVAEQVEDPAEARRRGAKAVVRREIVRLVTPGTLTEETLLDARQSNFLAAYAEVRDEAALAWADISTGDLRVMRTTRSRLGADLGRLMPREVLVSEGAGDLAGTVSECGATLTERTRGSFDSSGAARRLSALFGVGGLDGYGSFGRAELAALGAIADYLDLTQRGRLPSLKPPVIEDAGRTMQIDASTRRSLEITRSMAGGRERSLLATIDRTLSAAGARLLEQRLAAPSRDVAEVRGRIDAVSRLREDRDLRRRLREALRTVPDIDRALARLALDRGGPRDLGAVRQALRALSDLLPEAEALAEVVPEAPQAFSGFDGLRGRLEETLAADLPMLARDGGFVAEGCDAELDETRRLRDEGRGVVAGLQAEYARLSGVPSLKIRHNNVLGYFIETTDTHAARMLAPEMAETFIHRQTTANLLRFTTLQLSDLETRILNAGAHALEIEKRLYDGLKELVLSNAPALRAASESLAAIDVAAALAELAEEGDWCRPVVDDSRAFRIEGGRHPVVERTARQAGEPFVPNDCDLSDGCAGAAIWLVTGPNMAGKSTFLRQNALIALLAQAGSHVPARAAHIGAVSQIFSRVGASDDLSRGRSTFMVEMVETAAILNQADDRALVILDEIGRGTATWDGLAIAWATLEHLHDVNRCRALFATHYHEMTALAGRLPGVSNATVAVREWKGDVVFLHEVRQGAADRSYGVQVARLAGLPPAVVKRARGILEVLERGDRTGGVRRTLADDLPLFAAAEAREPLQAERVPEKSAVEEALREVQPDALTPREALDLVYRLRAMLEPGQPGVDDTPT